MGGEIDRGTDDKSDCYCLPGLYRECFVEGAFGRVDLSLFEREVMRLNTYVHMSYSDVPT
jgi:hypothetical protein